MSTAILGEREKERWIERQRDGERERVSVCPGEFPVLYFASSEHPPPPSPSVPTPVPQIDVASQPRPASGRGRVKGGFVLNGRGVDGPS